MPQPTGGTQEGARKKGYAWSPRHVTTLLGADAEVLTTWWEQQGHLPGLWLLAQVAGTPGELHKPSPAVGQVEVSCHTQGTKAARDFVLWPLEGTPPGECQVWPLRFKRAWQRSQLSQDIPPIAS